MPQNESGLQPLRECQFDSNDLFRGFLNPLKDGEFRWPLGPEASLATQAKTRLGPLTSFRFFAAIGVVIYHYIRGADSGFPVASRFHLVASYGSLGVAFFFILSGYILAYNYAGTSEKAKRIDVRTFWWKRFARIYPLFLFALLICVPLNVPQGVQMHGALGAATRLPVTFFANLLLIHAWHQHLNGTWNPPGWSLSAEAFFYLMFPLLVRRLTWIREAGWKETAAKVAVLLATCLLIMSGVDYALAMGARETFFLMYFPPLNFALFVMGTTLCLFEQRVRLDAPRVSYWLNIVCGVIVLVVLGCIGLNVGFPAVPKTACASIFFCALIWLGGSGAQLWVSRLLSWSPLLLLGEASYAVYLLHYPVFLYFVWLWAAAGFGTYDPSAHSNQLFYLSYVIALIGVSILAYKFLEQPARSFLQSRRPWSWKPILSKAAPVLPDGSAVAVQQD